MDPYDLDLIGSDDPNVKGAWQDSASTRLVTNTSRRYKTLKMKTYGPSKRSESEKIDFIRRMKQKMPERLIFTDGYWKEIEKTKTRKRSSTDSGVQGDLIEDDSEGNSTCSVIKSKKQKKSKKNAQLFKDSSAPIDTSTTDTDEELISKEEKTAAYFVPQKQRRQTTKPKKGKPVVSGLKDLPQESLHVKLVARSPVMKDIKGKRRKKKPGDFLADISTSSQEIEAFSSSDLQVSQSNSEQDDISSTSKKERVSCEVESTTNLRTVSFPTPKAPPPTPVSTYEKDDSECDTAFGGIESTSSLRTESFPAPKAPPPTPASTNKNESSEMDVCFDEKIAKTNLSPDDEIYKSDEIESALGEIFHQEEKSWFDDKCDVENYSPSVKECQIGGSYLNMPRNYEDIEAITWAHLSESEDENDLECIEDENGHEYTSDGNVLKCIEDGNGLENSPDENGPKYIEDGNGAKSIGDGNGAKCIEDENGPKCIKDGNGPKCIEDGNGPKCIEDGNGPKCIEDGNLPKCIGDGNGFKCIEDDNGLNCIEDGNGHKCFEDRDGRGSIGDQKVCERIEKAKIRSDKVESWLLLSDSHQDEEDPEPIGDEKHSERVEGEPSIERIQDVNTNVVDEFEAEKKDFKDLTMYISDTDEDSLIENDGFLADAF